MKDKYFIRVLFYCRYFILYEYGGIYTQLDLELLRSLDRSVLSHSCVVAQEPLAHAYLMFDNKRSDRPFASSDIMLCKAKHPFLRYILSHLYMEDFKVLNIKVGYKWYFHDLVVRYNKDLREKYSKNSQEFAEDAKINIPESEGIFLAPPKYFMPTWKADSTNWIRKVCDQVSKTTYIQGKHFNQLFSIYVFFGSA